MKKSKSLGRKEWRRIIAEQASSGVSVSEYCAGSGIAEASFHAWKQRLASEETSSSANEIGLSQILLKRLLGFATVLVVGLAVFWPATHFALLQWDDQYHLTNNPFIQLDSPGRFAHFWDKPYGKLYIPLAYNAWAIIYGMSFDEGGVFSPVMLHAVNVILHAICGGMVFWLLSLLQIGNSKSVFPALAGAMLFVLHPLQVESVAWISEFRGLLGSVLGLGAMIAYVMAARRMNSARCMAINVLGMILLAAGLLCKPSVAAIPLMLIVIDRLILGREWRSIAWQVWPWVILGIGDLILTAAVQPAGGATHVALWLRPMVAGDALAFYLLKLVWPFALCADYSRTPALASQTQWFWLAGIIPIVVLVMLIWRPRKEVWAAFGIFVAALAPVLGFASFDFQRISTVADRYVYLAMLGPALLAAKILATWNSRWTMSAAAILLALLGWRSTDQLKNWRDDRVLWSHALDVNPRAIVAMGNLAQQATDTGDVATARNLFLRAAQLAPNRANAFVGLAKIARDSGDFATAESWYRKAVDAEPSNAVAYNDLGSLLAQKGEIVEAEKWIRQSIAADPDYSDGWTNLGSVLRSQRKIREAIESLNTALRIDPRNEKAMCILAYAEDDLGDREAADQYMRQAIRIDRSDTAPLKYLAGKAMRANRFGEAEELLRSAMSIDSNDIVTINDLGQTLATEGKIDEAIAVFERGVQLHPDSQALRDNLESARELRRRKGG